VTLPRTPSQTVGPFFAIGLCRRAQHELDPDGIELSGRLLDGRGEPISDGMLELWDSGRRLWGRSPTDADGRFRFVVPRDAHRVEAWVHARGLLRQQLTRIDLRAVRREGGGLVLDVRMQGDGATVFYAH
jgi:protocatechuate 3,4-dioxygenase, alpha subunit